MAVTYGHIAHGEEDLFPARARELLDVVLRVITPEKAAMFTAFPFRELHDPAVDVNLNVENADCSRKVANVVLWQRLSPHGMH